MDRRRKLIVGLAALLVAVAVAAALGYGLANRPGPPDTAKDTLTRKQAIQDACASRDTFHGLKQLVFRQASSGRVTDPGNFDVLSAAAFVRMEEPVVARRDEELGITACRGRFILELPPGAEAAFAGERRLAADVDYEIQAAADGSGSVYRMRGAERIVAQLVAFDLQGRRLAMPAPAATPESVAANDAGKPPEGSASVERRASPSFDCDDARTRGELLVCGNPSLAAKDRAMAALYGAANEEGDRRIRRALRRTRDGFLAYRDRCASVSCVSQAYDGRMREIRDIMADMR